jgi:thiol-disulfide isomerase/thioredoxin
MEFFNDNVVMLKKGDFDSDAKLKKGGKVVVLYFAKWCGHCKSLKPAYQEFANNAKGFTVAAVDGDDNDGLTDLINSKDEYTVHGFPTIVSYNDGIYFSTYGPSDGEEGRRKFRTVEDLMEYAKGIGKADVTMTK